MAHQGGDQEKHKTTMVSSTGYCFSDNNQNQNLQTHMLNQLHQSFEPNPEIYNITTAMDTNPSSSMWKGFFKNSDFTTTSDHQALVPPDHTTANIPWHVDDSSLRSIFPCEANQRPSQGLSLSLSATNPPTIALQSFEFVSSSSRPDGYFGKSLNIQQQQEQDHHQQHMIQDGFLGKNENNNLHQHQSGLFQIRSSKYLGPAQELLSEFCNLGTQQTHPKTKIKLHKSSTSTSHWQEEHENTTSTNSSSKKQSLCNLELLDLQRRKTKLLSMLEEVDRRYRHYCDQMKAVVSSFEAVAGHGAAGIYSALASKAMSRHFRCLRDGIVAQIRATRKALGEKDTMTGAPGMTRGETPRLRLLDQTLRQQKALQQMSIMESHPWRPQRGLPERSVSVLRAWLFEHFLHPYPSDVDKHILARQTGLSRSQVSNWFINARVRLWKPMVEEMYLEETKDQENMGMGSPEDDGRPKPSSQVRLEDQKPTPDQLVRIDSECLSSIINNHPEKNDTKHRMNKSPQNQPQHNFGRVMDTFGAIELDFSSYNHHRATVSYENTQQGFGGGGGGNGSGGSGGGGVSLTLGLNQHGGNSLFYPRDDIDDCQPVQFSLLDGEGQNLPYRNLMGAQLLHDLAG